MAEKKKNNKIHDLRQTKGNFQLRGIVTGVEKDSFYKEIQTKNNNAMRMVNFGVQYFPDKTLYANLNGMEKKSVWFSKKDKDGKYQMQEVPWADRFKFKEKDYRLLGINLGLTKTVDVNGNEVNDKKMLSEFDACQHINDNLKDDTYVFMRGKVEYSTYNDKHQKKLVPNQISLCKPLDFDKPDTKLIHDFTQEIVFQSISKNEDGSFTVVGNIVTYNSIEETEFKIKADCAGLARNFKKLKPYTLIQVYGRIEVEADTEEVEVDDGWGEPNPMEQINSPVIREFVITGADKDSIDTTIYSEDEFEAALSKIKATKTAKEDFGDNDDWGSKPIGGSDDDDEDDWD